MKRCKDCICFRPDLSALDTNLPKKSGCAECVFVMKLPTDNKSKTPTKIVTMHATITDADADASKCPDFTERKGV